MFKQNLKLYKLNVDINRLYIYTELINRNPHSYNRTDIIHHLQFQLY